MEHKIVIVRGIKCLATGRYVEELVCSLERTTLSQTVNLHGEHAMSRGWAIASVRPEFTARDPRPN